VDLITFYAELKSWQVAIGSLLGFGALVAGALINFRLNRKRDALLRREEVITIASALYGEMVLLRRSIARLANAVGARSIRQGLHGDSEVVDKHFIEQFSLPTPKLYPALASKVGMLPSQLALEVVRFYSRIEEAESWVPRLQEVEGRPYSYGVNYVLDPAIDAVTGVLPALREIEQMAGIVEQEGTPDIKKALDAQEIENMSHE